MTTDECPLTQLVNWPYPLESDETTCSEWPCCAANLAVELIEHETFPGLRYWRLTTFPNVFLGWGWPLMWLCLKKEDAIRELQRRIQKLNCRARDILQLPPCLLPELKLLVRSYVPDGHCIE